MVKIGSVLSAAVLVGFAGVGAAQASAITLGTATGSLAVVYNCSVSGSACENPANVSYYQFVQGPGNTHGGTFQFDATPQTALGGASFNDVFSGQPVGSSQFGLDLSVRGAGYGSGTPSIAVPTLNAIDYAGAGGITTGGPVDFAVNDYGFGGGGASNAFNSVVNSLFRGGSGSGSAITLTMSNLTHVGTLFTLDLAGTLTTDGLIHWYNPTFGTSPLGPDLSGNLLVSGTLTYDSAADPFPGVDYYSGTLTVQAELPEPASMSMLGAGLIGLVGAVRRRRQG